ncbi:cytochrome c-type biogenesis protein [Marinobacter sp. X15-166B]|uniref:cytochrome c-type biogenesis protein n=1 Tax=Marinobacter sp. X15-166B TaxID=1897620 RepID=UPI00085CBE30|nr:cytochrome c-type biogenesis protein [Marinobacter sp. X15-166B]OEY67100.1 cytochrome C [Marinobacter sp. X15-166B]
MRNLIFLFILVALLPSSLLAATEVYPLATAEERERFQGLLAELRCPKCQNQNIADSDAPIAQDMRDETYRMVRDGASNEEVFEALIARFGEFVRYKPQFDRRTALLWTTPIIVVLIGLLVVIGTVVRAKRQPQATATLTDEERQRAQQILEDGNPKP